MQTLILEDLLKTLVSHQTVNPPGNELQLCESLAHLLSDLGFETKIQNIAPNRGNIIAVAGSKNPQKSLMLTGHLDVVGIDDGWSSDPFTLTNKDSRYYGRGVCDMKGAIAAMILAAQKYVKQESLEQNQLILAFVADEEVSGEGTRYLLQSGIVADCAVIGEPTQMNVCVAHRGVDRYKVTIYGEAGHASKPKNESNPLYVAANLLLGIETQQSILALKSHPVLPPPSITATIVNGGVQGNAIPETCSVIVDRRTIPGEDHRFVLNEANGIINSVLKKYPLCHTDISSIAWIPPTEPLKNSPLQHIAYKVLKDMHIPSEITYFPAGCDQYQFINHGIDTVLIGPGSLAQAHTTNEYIEVNQLEEAAEFYFRLMQTILFV